MGFCFNLTLIFLAKSILNEMCHCAEMNVNSIAEIDNDNSDEYIDKCVGWKENTLGE